MGRTPFPYSIVIVSMLALTGAHSWADQPGAYPVNPTMGSPGWYPQAAPYTGWQGDSRGPGGPYGAPRHYAPDQSYPPREGYGGPQGYAPPQGGYVQPRGYRQPQYRYPAPSQPPPVGRLPQAERAELTSERDRLQAELDAKAAELDKANQELQYTRATLGEARAALQRADSEYHEGLAEQRRLSDELAAAKSAHSASRERVSALATELETAHGQLDAYQQQIAELERRA